MTSVFLHVLWLLSVTTTTISGYCSQSVIVDGPNWKRTFKNSMEGITSDIWEGTKVLKRISENVKERNFDKFSLSDERDMVSWLREQFSDFSSKFAHSKDLFDGMYCAFQTEHIQQKSILEGKTRELETVSQDLNEIETEIRYYENQKRTTGYDLIEARASRREANRRLVAARNSYNSSIESRDNAKVTCYATIWIPFVNIGTCLDWDAKVTDAENAYLEMESEYDRAERKVKIVENFQQQFNNLKTALNAKLNSKSVLQTTHTKLKLKVWKQEAFLQELAVLQERIQLVKTEVDVIQGRLQSIQGSRGASLEAFIEHLGELFRFIFKDNGFMRRNANNIQARRISNILTDLSDTETFIREKKQIQYESLCSGRVTLDLCNFIFVDETTASSLTNTETTTDAPCGYFQDLCDFIFVDETSASSLTNTETTMDAPCGYFHIVSHLNGLCLGLDPVTKELTMMNKRSDNDRVLWRWKGKSLINKAGLAMDLEGNINKAGTRVQGWDHHGQINQQWRQEGHHIRCEGNDLVLDIFNGDMNPGARVKAWTKNIPNTPNQMWKLEPSC